MTVQSSTVTVMYNGADIGSGSVITKDVPDDAIAVGTLLGKPPENAG